MTPTLRITSFTFVALAAFAAISAGHGVLGVLVLLLAAASLLPPFPPMVGGFAAVMLAPFPAAIAVHAGEFSPMLLALPALAAMAISLQWRVAAWSGALTAAVCLCYSLLLTEPNAAAPVGTLVASVFSL